jgi:hypothetical protein
MEMSGGIGNAKLVILKKLSLFCPFLFLAAGLTVIG